MRQGRAIAWFAEALAPLQGTLSKTEIHRLVLAVRATTGIEALVWLTDVAGLSRDEAAKLYDERFCRMWEFYLAGSETSFRVDGNMVFQLQLAKRQEVVPLTRDYIAEREAELRRREATRPRVRHAAE